MMIRYIEKILRSPITVSILLADRYLWPQWLRLQGVNYEAGLTLVGLPEIRMMQGGEIKLGNNVNLYSRRRSNPLQLHSPCVFRLLQPNASIQIGDGSALSGTVICAATSVQLGKRVLIGANCKLADTDFHPLLPEVRQVDRNQGAASKPIVIGDDVFIGAHAIILKGTVLEEGCVVGAGAVVSGTFPRRSILAGNPATIIKKLDSSEGLA
jgi:acetyltransferase-like isoleucine patch superfamily enzyme